VARLKELAQRKGWPVSFSAGVVTFKTMPDESGELLHKADALMYEVKKSGKNAVRYAEE